MELLGDSHATSAEGFGHTVFGELERHSLLTDRVAVPSQVSESAECSTELQGLST